MIPRKIISASRRTDLPAFYTEWLLNRLREGYAFVRHPFSKRWIYVSLTPESIGAIVFWSKDYSNLLSSINVIEKTSKNLYFHFTITGISAFEPNVPPVKDTTGDFIFISRRYSPGHIVWRFDPICITDSVGFEHYREMFIKCAERLKGYVRYCYISFVNPYKKTQKNLNQYNGHKLIELSVTEKRQYALELAEIAERYNIKLYACSNDFLVSERIQKGACINGRYLSGLFDIPLDITEAPTRPQCGCTKSIDIGTYNTCLHGCLYCYATDDLERAKNFYKAFDQQSPALSLQAPAYTTPLFSMS